MAQFLTVLTRGPYTDPRKPQSLTYNVLHQSCVVIVVR